MRTLTPAEDQIVRLKMMGFLNKEIAAALGRSTNTIMVHFRNIYEKTDVSNDIEMYNWYSENVIGINIRKLLQVGALLLILAPSIIGRDQNLIRANRAPRTQTSKTARSGRRSENDFYLYN